MQTLNGPNTAVISSASDSAPIPETDNVEVKKCHSMISSLSEEEKEKAARTSYRYFIASTTTSKASDNKPSKEERDKYAMAMARRHLRAEDGDEEKALKKMRNTIEYRDKMKVDLIRQCFYEGKSSSDKEESNDDDDASDDSINEDIKHHQNGLSKELMDAKLFVRGYSKDKRALFIARSHKFEASGYDHDWYMKYNIYTLERALACTERASNGQLEKVVAVMDMGGYSSKVRTPISLSKDLIYCLADHYPERVEKILMVDAPLLYRVFWNIIYPFIDKDTKKKIAFVRGDNQKTDILGSIISKEQSMKFMQPDGELKSDLDMKAYLYDTPFDFTYEECC